jgi:hypothetical protein
MPQDFWMPIYAKLESAAGHLEQASRAISPESLPPHYVAIQSMGAIVSNPNWQRQLHSALSAFLVDCRSVPDIIQSCFGAYRNQKWVSMRPLDEAQRRVEFQDRFKPLYIRFTKLPLSYARVDTVHNQGFPEFWVRTSGRRYSLLLHRLTDTERAYTADPSLPLRSSISSQWAATMPPQSFRYLPGHFFFKTAGGNYKPLFPECNSYLGKTQELVAKARKLYETVHNGRSLTKPPRS